MQDKDEWVKSIYAVMEEDEKIYKRENDTEAFYVFCIAQKWVDMNVKTREEFNLRFDALRKIVESEEFQEVRKICKTTLRKTYSIDEAKRAAGLIIKLSESELYLENKELAHYGLLDKYKLPETYRTDSFRVHANIMKRMCAYLVKFKEL